MLGIASAEDDMKLWHQWLEQMAQRLETKVTDQLSLDGSTATRTDLCAVDVSGMETDAAQDG